MGKEREDEHEKLAPLDDIPGVPGNLADVFSFCPGISAADERDSQ